MPSTSSRTTPSRSSRGLRRSPRRGAGPRAPWLWLGLLLLIGGAVLAARSLGRPLGAETIAVPTPTPTPTSPLNSPTTVRTASATQGPEPAAAAAAAAPLATPRPTSQPKGVSEVRTSRPTPTSPLNGSTVVRTPTPAAVVATDAPTSPPNGSTPVTNARAAGAPTPTSPLTAPTVVRSSPSNGGPSVALTFDAGADRGYAQDILDVLQQERVVASFGITGNWARANADLVQRMAGDGHLVFNHTLDHRSFTGASDKLGGLSAAARRAELEDAEAIIAPLIGHSTRPYYRLPYGDDDARVAGDVESAGYTHKVGWTVDSLGWRGSQSVDIVARCLKLAAPGAVYVLHVGRASQDAIALPQLIRGLRDRGFAFHRVDQG